MIKIAPSTDPVQNFEELVKYAREIQSHAHFLHVDVMDGNFVPRKTFGADVIAKLKNYTLLMLDVHLMVQEPNVEEFLAAGANVLTLHYEAYKSTKTLIKDLKKIRKASALAGLSIKPETPVEKVFPLLKYVDVVLVMSVEPGLSGQKFIENSYKKITILRDEISAQGLRTQIEVDGGVNLENSKKLQEAGADILVSGSFIYNSHDRIEAIKKLSK